MICENTFSLTELMYEILYLIMSLMLIAMIFDTQKTRMSY